MPYQVVIPKPDAGWPDNLQALNTLTDAPLTHVEDTSGEVYKIFSINKKSISLNQSHVPNLTRLAPNKINSLGKVVEQEDKDSAGGHAERDHAILSASGANRWLHCTPSALIETRYPDTTSDAADQGTAAHELAEHKLRALLGSATVRPESLWHDEEMEDHTDAYADHVMAELARTKAGSPAAFCSIEERLDFSHIVPDGFGTGDAIIVGDDTMTIIDLKYGKGVEVSAENNPQMRLYALGALARYGMIYDIHKIRMVIFQPRLNNVSVDEATVGDLLQWASEVVEPTAAKAAAGEGELTPGSWCTFCKHSARCPAVHKQYFDIVPMVDAVPAEPEPDTLTDEQISQIVAMSVQLKKWLGKVEDHALKQALNGHRYTGLKLVEGRSVRRFTDKDAVAKTVERAGHDPYKHTLLGITDLTKLLGKKQFEDTLGQYIDKPEGKPTLVPATDKRQELTTATPDSVFNQIA
ncbi:DUF2800 domain-containing protein [Corynebacterium dentalis]|uniref:DUF2800 domain-containing protein n=1 Tax=Corynebacterium dentalis TaxID=2014528 RepID=UPI00289CB796|nr:DUF2800 domain-containing protein [Corynebacterium dentalis]